VPRPSMVIHVSASLPASIRYLCIPAAAAHLTACGIRPDKCKSEPCAPGREGVVVHHDADLRTVLGHCLQFRSVFVSRHGPVALLIVADLVRSHAARRGAAVDCRQGQQRARGPNPGRYSRPAVGSRGDAPEIGALPAAD
jgi:hypothetical protein